MDTIPGVKAFFSELAVTVMGPEAHHRKHTVILFLPERGACRKTTQRSCEGRTSMHLMTPVSNPPSHFSTSPHSSKHLLITHRQHRLVDINAVQEAELGHNVLGQMPGSVDADCQGVHYLPMNPMEGCWEVSALLQNTYFSKIGYNQDRSNLETRQTSWCRTQIQQAQMSEKTM